MDIKIGNDWDNILAPEFSKPYFKQLNESVENAYNSQQCFPPKDNIFNAFKHVPYSNVKVVILGQDPYPGAGNANGMAFALNNGVKIAASLNNIFKEVESDLCCTINKDKTDLVGWASQGVLLLNSALSVQSAKAGSHSKLGWATFTDSVIKLLNSKIQPIVFMLWGNNSIKKSSLITNNDRHLILTAPHPSPLSAYRGFFGCKHFSICNGFLIKNKTVPIDFYKV